MAQRKIYLAGGCFWGLQELFRSEPGIINILVGYTGGDKDNPNYANHPGHAETLEISYDDKQTNYDNILDFFFRVHDPTTVNQQGNDHGESYRSAIFYQSENEKQAAQNFIEKVNASKRWLYPVVTTLEPFTKFWSAEDYHQDYLQKNPGGYTCHYLRFEDVFPDKSA